MLKKTIILLLIFILPSMVEAADVIISEIAWMGNKESHNNEWIKLYNNSLYPIDLAGWKLITADNGLEINLTGEIPEQGFFILERSNDETIPEVKADLIYTKSLNNKGEHLILINDQKKIIDEVNCSAGWFSGNNETKETMKRVDASVSGNNASNWQADVKTPILSCFEGIVINEVLPSPEGPDIENEWIKIFNQNTFIVDISGWKISDIEGTVRTYTFPPKTNIKANSLLLLSRLESKITLNNNGDGLKLVCPNGKITDSLTWGKAIRNQSYDRTGKWNTALSSEPTDTQIEKQNNNVVINKEIFTASLNKREAGSVLFAALATAVFSGAIILFLKSLIKQKS